MFCNKFLTFLSLCVAMWMGYWLIFAKKKVVRSECALIIMYYA